MAADGPSAVFLCGMTQSGLVTGGRSRVRWGFGCGLRFEVEGGGSVLLLLLVLIVLFVLLFLGLAER